MPITSLADQLRRDESEVLHAYKDSLGYWTIGVGRMIDERKFGGISKDESSYLLQNDINKAAGNLRLWLPWTDGMDDVRRAALQNMTFNMGRNFLEFTHSIALLRSGRWSEAADQLLKSKWADQVGDRAKRLAEQVRLGTWQ